MLLPSEIWFMRNAWKIGKENRLKLNFMAIFTLRHVTDRISGVSDLSYRK